jgi:hypothetical protein
MKNEEGGDLGKLFSRLAEKGRASNNGYDIQLIQKEAEALYKVRLGYKYYCRFFSENQSFCDLKGR